jgi:hypothetical protein
MRYGFGLILVGVGGLLVYAGFSGDSVMRMIRDVITTGDLSRGKAIPNPSPVGAPPGNPGYTDSEGTPLPSLPWSTGQPV